LSVAEPGATRNGRPDYPQIGERLRASRRERGLSLRDLAERLGVSPSLISQIERGRANPSVSTLYAIVSELDVSLDDLLFDRRSVERPDAAPRTPAEASDARPLPLQRAQVFTVRGRTNRTGQPRQLLRGPVRLAFGVEEFQRGHAGPQVLGRDQSLRH
jgi:transcriptional regulator with XRE-family HTH domain